MQESLTRWGSRQAMIHRVLEQQTAIKRVLSANRQTASLSPTWQDLDVLSAIDSVLAPLADFTDVMSGEKYVTVSSVIPILHHLCTGVLCDTNDESELAGDMKRKIRAYMQNKYEDDATTQFLHVATMLDPRYKSSYSGNATTTAKETIIMEAIRASTNEADGAETQLFKIFILINIKLI